MKVIYSIAVDFISFQRHVEATTLKEIMEPKANLIYIRKHFVRNFCNFKGHDRKLFLQRSFSPVKHLVPAIFGVHWTDECWIVDEWL